MAQSSMGSLQHAHVHLRTQHVSALTLDWTWAGNSTLGIAQSGWTYTAGATQVAVHA